MSVSLTCTSHASVGKNVLRQFRQASKQADFVYNLFSNVTLEKATQQIKEIMY